MCKRQAAILGVLAISVLITSGTSNVTARDRHQLASSPRIVCGITGCFEVKPGCRAEMRYSGRGGGQVAVIICDRR